MAVLHIVNTNIEKGEIGIDVDSLRGKRERDSYLEVGSKGLVEN